MERIKFNLDDKGVRIWLFIIAFFAVMTWIAVRLPQIMS